MLLLLLRSKAQQAAEEQQAEAVAAVGAWVVPAAELLAATGTNAIPTVAAWVVPAATLTPGAVDVEAQPAVATWVMGDAALLQATVANATPAVAEWVIPAAQVQAGEIFATATPAVAAWITVHATVISGAITSVAHPTEAGWVVPPAGLEGVEPTSVIGLRAIVLPPWGTGTYANLPLLSGLVAGDDIVIRFQAIDDTGAAVELRQVTAKFAIARRHTDTPVVSSSSNATAIVEDEDRTIVRVTIHHDETEELSGTYLWELALEGVSGTRSTPVRGMVEWVPELIHA